MSERHSKRKHKRPPSPETDGFKRGSGVNYSQISSRHIDDSRYEKHKLSQSNASSSTSLPNSYDAMPAATSQTKVSAQMEAVMRLMTGKEERTIAEKIKDSNRPTWEQYKKDNEDKLDMAGVEQKKMVEYRMKLDRDREKRLGRGVNHGGLDRKKDKRKSKSKKKKKRKRSGKSRDESDISSDDNSSEDSYDSSDRKRKHKRKKRSHRSRHSDDESRSSDDSDSSSYERGKSERKSSKRKKKRSHGSEHRRGGGDEKSHKKSKKDEDDADKYRLSSFFTKSSSEDSQR